RSLRARRSNLDGTRSRPGPDHAELPGTREPGLFLVGADLAHLLLGQTDIVEPVQEAVLAECIDLEAYLLAVRPSDRLGFQLDRHHCVGAFPSVFHQLVDDLLGESDRQDAVLEAIIVEDVGKARRDDAADAVIEERPGRVLAARPAAESVGADQDLSVAVGRLVETEMRVLRAVGSNA